MMIHNDDRQGQTEYLFKHCEKRNAMWIEARATLVILTMSLLPRFWNHKNTYHWNYLASVSS